MVEKYVHEYIFKFQKASLFEKIDLCQLYRIEQVCSVVQHVITQGKIITKRKNKLAKKKTEWLVRLEVYGERGREEQRSNGFALQSNQAITNR